MSTTQGRTTVTVLGKGRKTRTVVVPAFAAERCAKLGSPLFVTRTGRRLTPREAWETMRRLGNRAGIRKLHPHMLRHTAATIALMEGSNIQAVRAMLGHSSLGTTQRYVEAAGSLEQSPAYTLAAKIAPKETP